MSCENGCTDACCCAEITRLRGGLHCDDYIHISMILEANIAWQLHENSCHLVDFNIFPSKIASSKRSTVRLFTTEFRDADDADYPGNDQFGTKVTLGLSDATQQPVVIPESYFGTWFDAGLYVHHVSDDPNSLMIINATVVEREFFSPAYKLPIDVAQYYWHCWRPGEDFLSEFDLGSGSDQWDGTGAPEGNGAGITEPWRRDDNEGGNAHIIQAETAGGDGEGGVIAWAGLKNENGRYIHYQTNSS